MGIRKEKLANYLLLLALAVYPFGQLPGIFVGNIFNSPFRIHLLDILIVFIVVFTIKLNVIEQMIIRYKGLFASILFSTVLSFFTLNFSIEGSIYLLRLIFYILFLLYLLKSPFTKSLGELISKALLVCSAVVSTLGWIQYLFLPDLVALKYFGWDDHYFRLTGAFLDPAFTGMILVFAIFLSLFFYLKNKRRSYLLLSLFFLLTLGFTYSRASFLSLVVGLFVMFMRRHKKLLTAFFILIASLFIILPRSAGGEGVKLTRTASSIQKLKNFEESFVLIQSSPLFGIGYNNVCNAKVKLNIDTSKQNNSCFGLDNSFLFLTATVGVVGIIGFVHFSYDLIDAVRESRVIIASLAALLVHTQFTNTLFYSWVIVWIALLVGARNALRSKL